MLPESKYGAVCLTHLKSDQNNITKGTRLSRKCTKRLTALPIPSAAFGRGKGRAERDDMDIQLQCSIFLHSKLFKLDITGSIIFIPKCIMTRLAAAFCPDPLGKLTALPQTF